MPRVIGETVSAVWKRARRLLEEEGLLRVRLEDLRAECQMEGFRDYRKVHEIQDVRASLDNIRERRKRAEHVAEQMVDERLHLTA